MVIEILDTNLQFVDYLYEFESFIWTDRYNLPGDFEIFAPAKTNNLKLFKRNYYIRIDVSEHIMIIEDIVWQSSAESGDHVKVTGRSLESILDRRIVWGDYTMPASNAKDLQTEVFLLFDKEIINGRNIQARKITNFTYVRDDTIPKILTSYPSGQFKGDSLLGIVETLADEFDYGWKIIYNEDTGKFVFSFFAGKDRTIEESGSDKFVIFSPEYNNVIESTYSEISNDVRNVMLIAGSWSEGGEEEPIYESIGDSTGLSRREMFYQSNVDKSSDESMSQQEYIDLMRADGGKELTKYKLVSTFDGKYETSYQFKYGRDFFIGDIVTVKDVFDHISKARVTEFIRSINMSNGEEAYPTFEMVLPDE